MPYIRKHQAGSDNFGHEWPHDGAVVEMPHDEAEALLVIPDGGFELAPGLEADLAPEVEQEASDAPQPITEVIPEPEAIVTADAPADEPEAKATPRRGRPRKTASDGE
ncbi:hypothetical protein ACIQGZ_16975 [Streptomyces sp. NPDC092296]|uniref:hypothetical protein n=1 Tax=Streptomyces sp. NPDC092296 TaxID=3366012 RepID=UPI003813B166